MVDREDSKSSVRKGVRVRVPPPAPYSGVAQLVEHRTLNPVVVGSNPTSAAILITVCSHNAS